MCFLQLIHGLVDRIMEVTGTPFVSPGVKTGYYIQSSDVRLVLAYLANIVSSFSEQWILTTVLFCCCRSLSFFQVDKQASYTKESKSALLESSTHRCCIITTIVICVLKIRRALFWLKWTILCICIFTYFWTNELVILILISGAG